MNYSPENIDYAYHNEIEKIYVNKNIHKDANINSNWSYRKYMQKNANDIMKYNMMSATTASGNNPYILYNNQIGSNVPFLYNNIYDNRDPNIVNNSSDLKQMYLNEEQMKARMVSPIIPTNKF
jgi:hypothetical protein